MHFKRNLLLVVLVLTPLLLNCIEKRSQPRRDRETPVTLELLTMVEESQRLRYNDTLAWEVVAEADLQHRQRVFELIAQGLINEPENLYRAAQILQYADPVSCRECYYLAYSLALEAVNKGFEEARSLTANCFDLSLIYSGQPQKYGTQFFQDSLGKWYLFEIDSLTTDSERVLWQVPKLDSIKAKLENLNQNHP